MKSSPLIRRDLQDAVMATAWAYYWKQEQVQYDSYPLTDFQEKDQGCPYRNTTEVSPEYGSGDTNIYSVCTTFPHMVYHHSLCAGGEPFCYSGSYLRTMTRNLWLHMPENTVLARWAATYNEEDARAAEAYGWFSSDSYLQHKDKDPAQIRQWFAENWKTLLEPGDLIVTFNPTGHAVLYMGHGILLESNGRKYHDGTEVYEQGGAINLFTVEDFYITGLSYREYKNWYQLDRIKEDQYALKYFMILRPLNRLVSPDGTVRSDVTVRAQARTRQAYPGLSIDRTVSLTPFGTAYRGQPVTYRIRLTNHSDSIWQNVMRGEPGEVTSYRSWYRQYYELPDWQGAAHRGLTVREPLPERTRLAEGSVSPGGTYDPAANTVTWSVNLAAGETAELSYTVIPETLACGELLVSEGGSVSGIPLPALCNTVGAASAAQTVPGTVPEQAADLPALYEALFGTRPALGQIGDLCDSLFTKALSPAQAVAHGLYVPQSAPSPAKAMLVRHFVGGTKFFSEHLSLARIYDFRLDYLSPGDILIQASRSGDSWQADGQAVYLGDGKFACPGTPVEIRQGDSILWDCYLHELFFLLRPSQSEAAAHC